jgi:hypothetical protein
VEAKASQNAGASADGASPVAKVTGMFSPKVEVIQGKPVTTRCSVEGSEPFFSKQLNEAATGPRDRPVAADLKEASGHGQDGRKPAPFLLELFCGTAGVCAQFRLQGGRALGVDHHLKRHKLKAAAVKLDLTQPWVQQLITRQIKLGRISGVQLGPPCGTASKARCIPVKRKLLRKGAPNPKPLRSSRYPLGFPWLRGVNRAKVLAANCLYKFSAELVTLCDTLNIPFTVENPANSLMWKTPFFKPLLLRHFFHVVDACEYGSDHKKATGFLANFDAPRLQQRCKGDHEHKAWSIRRSEDGEWKFDTAAEAEYPSKLARELAASFIDHLMLSGKFQLHEEVEDYAFKVSAGAQPRRTRGPLLSEYKTKVEITQPPWQGIPVGAKMLDSKPVQGEMGRKAG